MTENQRDSLLQSEHWPVILCFFERFGETLGMATKFQGIENVVLANKCDEDVVSFFHKLLHSFGQRLLKRYYKYLWEKALVVFAETYQIECVEALRKGGYLSLSVVDRLPLIKELCEAQFDVCAQLKDKVNSDFSAEELRLKPLVQDKSGDGYWLFLDADGQFVLYKEVTSRGRSSDVATMQVVACTMDELDEFLHKLRPDGVQQAGSRTVGITGGQNKGEEVCGDEADRGGCDAYCEICHVDRDPDKLLLCDSCDHGYHTDCLSPPLSAVPPGDWHCSPCIEDKLYTVIEKRQKDIANLVRKADRCRRREAKCLKLQKEAPFLAGLSTGRRTRNWNVSDKEFYSYKAFDHAIQEAIYQNETKSCFHMNGTKTAHHFDHTLAALCDPMRRQTRAVSKLATEQVELAHNRHGKHSSSSESAAESFAVLSDNVSSFPACKERDSVSNYSSGEAESEETASVSDSSSCRSCNIGQAVQGDWRKPLEYCHVTRVNGTHRALRASRRVASHRLAKLVQSGALTSFNENPDEEESEFEMGSGVSDASDCKQVANAASADTNITMTAVRRSLRKRVRLIVSDDSSDDNYIERGSLTAVKRQQLDNVSGESSSLELEDNSDDVIWRRKRTAIRRNESPNSVTERKQYVWHCDPSDPTFLHYVQKDHCYARVRGSCRFVCRKMSMSSGDSDVEQTLDSELEINDIAMRPRRMRRRRKRHCEVISAKRKVRTACEVISAANAVNSITSEACCGIYSQGRMVENDIDNFSSSSETIRVTCCNKDDRAIDEFSSD